MRVPRPSCACAGLLAGLVVVSTLTVPAQAVAGSRPPQAPAAAQAPRDAVAEARHLARSGKRAEALHLLQERLSGNPGDLDARTLLGTVLLWDGRYDEARAELTRVLSVDADYADALGALAYLELWSGNYARSADYSARALARTPEDVSLLLARARALESLGRPREALAVLRRLLAVDPSMTAARQMRDRIQDDLRQWRAGYAYNYDGFDDGRPAWQEHQVMVGRSGERGSSVVRFSQSERHSRSDAVPRRDQQIEVDLYPKLRRGTYMYLNAGWSPDAVFYPEYRLGADLYQSLGKGVEASIGYHRLQFGDGVDIYIGSLSKYLGNWLLTGQVFLTPKAAGTSQSYHGAVRRYFGDREYVGLRYRHGAWNEEARQVDDVLVLDSDGLSAEVVKRLGSRLELTLRGAWAREDRPLREDVQQYSAAAQLYVRF